jgi:transposase
MPEPMSCCSPSGGRYCDNCDVLLGLDGLHVIAVRRDEGRVLNVTVESAPGPVGCPDCGVVAVGHGRLVVRLVDTPSAGVPVILWWSKRRWVCTDSGCSRRSFVESDERVARPRGRLTVRAARWAIEQLRREHASVAGLARQLGTTWKTVWAAVRPLLEQAATDETRFAGVSTLGVDEHVWHHVSTK